MDDNNCETAKTNEPKSETSDWRAEFTPHVRRKYLEKILDTLKKGVSSSNPNTSYRMVRYSQNLEEKAFHDATSKDDYIHTITGEIMRLIQKSRHHIVAASSSNPDLTQTSMVVDADQNSRLQNVCEVSCDFAGNPVRQGIQSGISASSRREIPGIQSPQKVVYQQHQQQELQHQLLKHKVHQSNICSSPIERDILNNSHHQQQQHIISQPSQLPTESQKSLSMEQSNATVYQLNQLLGQENTVEQQQLSSCWKKMPNSMQQPVGLQKSVESAATSKLANTAECHDQAYQKLQSMREECLPQLKNFCKMLDVQRQKAQGLEMAENYKKKMMAVDKLIKFLSMHQNDIVRLPKKTFEYYQEMILKSVKVFQQEKSACVRKHAQLCQPSDGQSQVFQLQELGNRKLQCASADSTLTSTPGDSFSLSSMQQGILSSQPQMSSTNSPYQQQKQQVKHQMTQPQQTQQKMQQLTVDTQNGILNQSVAAASSGISKSCLHIKSTNPDGSQQSSTKQPLKRLLNAVESLSPKSLSDSVSEIGSVMNLIDMLAGTACDYSRAAVGEDLTSEPRCRLQAGTSLCKTNYPNQSTDQIFDLLESTATYRIKRQRIEPVNALLDEIRCINQLMVETVIDLDPTEDTTTGDAGEGTTVRCTYRAVAFNENLRMHYASKMLPVLSLRLLVRADYPNSSPIILDGLNVGWSSESKESADLTAKTRLRFNGSLRQLSVPMSLSEMAKTWDVCARAVFREFAQQVGGECFSSRFGTWENRVSA
ncbi:hypothetical protein ACOSP7_026107 [Xanthoceras sorbifolium]